MIVHPSHRIWTDFQHRTINTEVVLTFPSGGGGNFLAPQLINNSPVCSSSSFNEYTANAPFLRGTKIKALANVTTDSLDAVYSILEAELWDLLSTAPCVISHYLPTIYDKVMEFRTKELIIIDTTSISSKLFTLILGRIKNDFHTDFNNKPYQIYDLIKYALGKTSKLLIDGGAKFNLSPNIHLQGGFLDYFNSVLLNNTNSVILWNFHIECAAHGVVPSVDNFTLYMDSIADGLIIHSSEQQLNYCDVIFLNQDRIKTITRIDYLDLFKHRKFNIYGSALDKLNHDTVSEYHEKNAELVREFLKLLSSDKRAEVIYRLNKNERII